MKTLVTFAIALSALLYAADAPADEAARGRAAMTQFGCVRCHEAPGLTADPRTGCTSCHQALESATTATLARRRAGVPRRAKLGGVGEISHFVKVPSLVSAARRLRSEWMVDYLLDPHDVRPHLEESMPRLPVSREDARAMVAFLTSQTPARPAPSPAPAPDRSRAARGREAFAQAGCPSCHTFGNVDFETGATLAFYRDMRSVAQLAPNLRHAKDRMDPATLLAWITNPQGVDPAATMPRPAISAADALAIRDFLLLGDAGAPVAPAPVPAVTPADRRVRFADVRRIFARSCVHCHAKTTRGAATSLGFSASALDLSSWQGVRAGTRLPSGERRSVISTGPGETPVLVARLLRRHEEAARDVSLPYADTMTARVADPGAPVGMPLGLPPVSPADIQLVSTWIAQGAPR